MAETLVGRLRRAEATVRQEFAGPEAEWPERRRRARLEVLREHVAAAYERLKTRHADGASGAESVRAHAAFMDDLLRGLYQTAAAQVRAAGYPPSRLVLVALGGYGRGELHPSSDLDLMLIHGGEITPYVQRMAQEILYTLWDLGLRVGHACRSLDDCLALARTDLPSRTSMQAARVLAGDQRLFRALQQTLRREVYRRDYPEFLAQMLAERDERYRRHGGSVYFQEPNVKESAGGLRDVHTALWLASARFGARTLRELEDKGHLTAKERDATDAALTFIWRVRNELHFLAGTKQDVLERGLQASVAKSLGYQDDEVRLGVETFMRDYYRHARTIHRISARLIARCQEGLARHGTVGRRGRRAALADGLVVFDGRLHLAEPALSRWTRRASCASSGTRSSWVRARRRAGAGPRGGRPHARRTDLAGLARSPGVVPGDPPLVGPGRDDAPADARHGRAGAYLPEFGALDCLVQYDHYHRYSVDQHSLLAVEVLEGLGPGRGADTDEFAQILAEVERPELLMLGILLHDIGKALGHGHAPKGVPLIKAVTRRLNLDADDAAAVEFLVEHHLLLSHMAERRDIDDPKTVERLAQVARFPAWLTMLYVLTCTDIRAVGPGVWNAWRGALLRTLYLRTRTHLAGRFPSRRAARSWRSGSCRPSPTRDTGRPRSSTSRRCRTATCARRRPSAWRPTCGWSIGCGRKRP